MDLGNRSDRKAALMDLNQGQQDYNDAAHSRLNAISQGESPSWLASPWLALQQKYAEVTAMNPNTNYLHGADAVDAAQAARDSKWSQDVGLAQQRYVEMLKAQGR